MPIPGQLPFERMLSIKTSVSNREINQANNDGIQRQVRDYHARALAENIVLDHCKETVREYDTVYSTSVFVLTGEQLAKLFHEWQERLTPPRIEGVHLGRKWPEDYELPG